MPKKSDSNNDKKIDHYTHTVKERINNPPVDLVILYDQPLVETKKKRVTGPFTVEAVSSQRVRSIDDISQPGASASLSARLMSSLLISQSHVKARLSNKMNNLMK